MSTKSKKRRVKRHRMTKAVMRVVDRVHAKMAGLVLPPSVGDWGPADEGALRDFFRAHPRTAGAFRRLRSLQRRHPSTRISGSVARKRAGRKSR